MNFVRTSVQMNLCQLNTFFLTFWPVCCVWAANIGPNWQCCRLAGSSKKAPRILIFSIAMGADYSFYVKSIDTFALTFFVYIISVLVSVSNEVGITCPPGWDRVYWSVEIWGDHGPALPGSDSPKWYEFRDITSWTRPINKSCYTYLALCLKRSNTLIFLCLFMP